MTTQPNDLIRRIDEEDLEEARLAFYSHYGLRTEQFSSDAIAAQLQAMRAALAALIKRGWVPGVEAERLTCCETALKNIKQYGELACVSAEHGMLAFGNSGKKPASKDVWQFPRHMLTEIDAALHPHEAEEKKT